MSKPSTHSDAFYEDECKGRPTPKTAQDYVRVIRNAADSSVSVDTVNVSGLRRTGDWLVHSIAAKLRAAKTFGELKQNAIEVRDQMARHGLFKEIDVELDKNMAHGASGESVHVNVNVEERGLVSGKVRMDTTGGDARGMLEVTLIQPSGQGETVTMSGSQSTGDSSTMQLRCSVPVTDEPDWKVDVGVYKNKDALLASHAVQHNRGLFAEYKTWSGIGQHVFKYDATWRQLMAPSTLASFAVREQAGHSLKSAITHTATMDHRDASDGTGTIYTLINEIAGFGGDCDHVKHTLGATHIQSLGHGCELKLSCRGGSLNPLPSGKVLKVLAPTSAPPVGAVRDPRLVDRFFLGGSTDVRGFSFRGIGPREREDALGGDAFVAAAAHVYTPIPIKQLREQSDKIRLHFFANGGSCAALPSGASTMAQGKTLLYGAAVAVGAGVAVRMSDVVDLELNYCVPVLYGANDRPSQGLQFGVSLGIL
eukprot:m.105822 g.105822  ORF g.105822 m.105822 type:complete len:480 (+) comp10562_c3_seq1:118-1557(+)